MASGTDFRRRANWAVERLVAKWHETGRNHMGQILSKEYIELLQSFIPDFYWFRNSHWTADNIATVTGTVIAKGQSARSEGILTAIEGREVECVVTESAYAADKFWFMPEQTRFDVMFKAVLPEGTSQFQASVRPKDGPVEPMIGNVFVQYVDWKNIEQTPPLVSIERVSGKGATPYNYHNNGATDFMRFTKLAELHGVDLKAASVLDWGCGCGRLTRHFLHAGIEVTGIDIDAENINWCTANLHSRAFHTTGLLPPTRFADDSFDLVIANSVLSHLTRDSTLNWIDEVHRVLKPGGLALLSYHGDFSLAGFCSKTDDFVMKVASSGFNADIKAQEVNDVISDPEYYRHTFMTDAFAIEMFSRRFKIEQRVTGLVSRFQNLAVLRKP